MRRERQWPETIPGATAPTRREFNTPNPNELTIQNSANFVLSPSYVNAWSATKRQVIVDLFIRTVFQNDLEFDHPELNLFL
jgi:hypothetical protein